MKTGEAIVVTMMSTKMTKGGQTTVPKEIRDSLGIAETSRVYWIFDGSRAYISPEPPALLAVESEEDFLERLNAGEQAVAEGRVRDASLASEELRERYALG